MKSIVHNTDCLEAMREMPNKAFDLAICDPPYGIGADKRNAHSSIRDSDEWKEVDWDATVPGDEYFSELFRVSENQIICGGNYFNLPPTQGVICWDKGRTMRGRSFSEWELIWTSFNRSARIFYYDILAFSPSFFAERVHGRIHPTQKPIELYRFLLVNYAKPGQSILDTHLGSGSSRIAAYDLGFDFEGYELDTDYFNAQEARFAAHIAQPKLFTPEPIQAEQGSLI